MRTERERSFQGPSCYPEIECLSQGFPGGASGEELPASAGNPKDVGSIPELGRFPGGGNGHPLQYSCLKNSKEPGGLQSVGSQRVGHDRARKWKKRFKEKERLHRQRTCEKNKPEHDDGARREYKRTKPSRHQNKTSEQ